MSADTPERHEEMSSNNDNASARPLVLIIEKSQYGDYCASISGFHNVSAFAPTREEAERQVLKNLDKELRLRARPPEEICAVALNPSLPPSEGHCRHQVRKDNLCVHHWRQLHSHDLPAREPRDVCRLCRETRPSKLDKWDDPCPYKAEHPDWPQEVVKIREEDHRRKLIAKGPPGGERKSPRISMVRRCQGQTIHGVMCTREASRDRLCGQHWKMRHGHELSPSHLWPQFCKLCDYQVPNLSSEWEFYLRCPGKEKEKS